MRGLFLLIYEEILKFDKQKIFASKISEEYLHVKYFIEVQKGLG